MENKTVIQQWAANEAIKRKKSYIHPETKKNIPGLPPVDSPPPPPTHEPLKNTYSKKSIAALILSLLLAGTTGYWVNNGELPTPEQFFVEIPAVEPEPEWKAVQNQSLEYNRLALEAWERLATKALNDYYRAVANGLSHPGLCIALKGDKKCYSPQKDTERRLH